MEYITWKYSDRPWYLIPFDIMIPNKEYDGKQYRCDEGIYVYSRVFPKALSILTNITPEIWYKRYILNIPDNEIIRCKYCGKELDFYSISKSYSLGIGSGYRDHWFCSFECNGLFHGIEASNRSSQTLNSIESQTKGRFTQWMNMGDKDDECIFYLGLTNDSLKYGVTSNLDQRKHYYYNDLNFIHEILISTRLKVGLLERDLKIYLNQISEYIDFKELHKVILFLKSNLYKYK